MLAQSVTQFITGLKAFEQETISVNALHNFCECTQLEMASSAEHKDYV